MPSTIPPCLGSLPSNASDKMHDRTLSLKKKNLQHPEIGLHPYKSLYKAHNSPNTIRKGKSYHTQVTGKDHTADRVFTTPLARSPCSFAHWHAGLGSRYLSTTPARRLRSSGQAKLPASQHRTRFAFDSSPSFTTKTLGGAFLHQIALLPGLLPSYLHNELLLAPGILSAGPVFLDSLNPLLCSTWVSCYLLVLSVLKY